MKLTLTITELRDLMKAPTPDRAENPVAINQVSRDLENAQEVLDGVDVLASELIEIAEQAPATKVKRQQLFNSEILRLARAIANKVGA